MKILKKIGLTFWKIYKESIEIHYGCYIKY